jgi:hypothetical protein
MCKSILRRRQAARIAVAGGSGANMRNQIGTAVLSLLVGTVVTLSFVDEPVRGQVRQNGAGGGAYPAPSHPSLKTLRTVADVMPYARIAAANESGFLGLGFGAAKSGETVILVTSTTDDEAEIYIEALMAALRERKVTPIRMAEYEIVGVSREDAHKLSTELAKMGRPDDSSRGWSEGCNPFRSNMEFLKTTRPDLYAECMPPDVLSKLPANLRQAHDKLATRRTAIPTYLNKYMDENPKVRGVFFGDGGPIRWSFKPQERWMGLFRFDNQMNALADTGFGKNLPADVWMMAEEGTMEAATSTDKVTVTDPEGTDVWWELTEEQAQRWYKGYYRRGHLFIFPQEAFGAYAQSTVNFPSIDPEWIPVTPTVKLHGKVVAHMSHAGFFPSLTEVWENGYLKEVQGGGPYGDLLRTLMKMPGINDKVWPERKEKGYFWHFETAMGTNPKAIRPDITTGRSAGDRERDGVIHWGLGVQHWHDNGAPGETFPASLRDFQRTTGLPASHSFHLHTYFNTIKYRIRATERWVTVYDRGRATSLDSPEVRALASRYGNPDTLLATDWVPEFPGINAPGRYEDYARDPWTADKAVWERVKAGNYPYKPYNPGAKK